MPDPQPRPPAMGRVQWQLKLQQRSPGFLALETSFVEDKFSHRLGGDGFRWIQVHLSCTFFPPQLHQLHLRSSGIRSRGLGTTVLEAPGQKGRRTVIAALGGAPRRTGEDAPVLRAPRGKQAPTCSLHRPQTGKPRPPDITKTGPLRRNTHRALVSPCSWKDEGHASPFLHPSWTVCHTAVFEDQGD